MRPLLVPTVLVALWWSLLAGTRRLLAQRSMLFMPDRYETLLAAMAAGHGDQFTGAWSRLGLAHPGPLWFWWAAPFVRLTDANPASLPLAAAVLAATSLTGIVVRIRRSTDTTTALVAATSLIIGIHQLSIPGLAMPWNPTVLILPLALAIVCLADVCNRGSLASILVAVAAGSFVAQCHLGAFALGMAVVAVTLGMGWWRRRAARGRSAETLRWELMAVAAVLVLAWLPVLVDQVAGTGNATKVTTYLATGRIDGAPAADDGPARQISTVGALREVAAVAGLSEPRTALWAGTDITSGRAHRPGPRSDLVALALVGLAVWGADLRRRTSPLASTGATNARRELGMWTCRVGLVALALTTLGALRIADHYRPYLIAAGAGTGLALWLGVAVVGIDRLLGRVPGRAQTTSMVAMAVCGIALALTPTGLVGFPMADAPISIDRVVHAGQDRGVAVRADDPGLLQPELQLTWLLEARGVRVAADGPLDAHFSDRQRAYEPTNPVVLTLVSSDAPLPEGCRTLGELAEHTICGSG